ncbi:MAG TPA: hypothetical protein VGM90_22245 [Kofleriaceae bacterium]|jgi:hypothetical protein
MAKSTDTWRIVPLNEIGPIRFWYTRAEVKKALGGKPTTFKRTPDSVSLTDTYKVGPHQVHVSYDAEDRCDLVEVSSAALGGPELDKRGFLRRPFARTLEWARGLDPDLLSDRRSFASLRLGITASTASELIDSVGAFRENYFDTLKRAYAH